MIQESQNDSTDPDEQAMSSSELFHLPLIAPEAPEEYELLVDEFPVDDGVIHNTESLAEQVFSSENEPDTLAEIKHQVPSRWVRPTLRRVVSDHGPRPSAFQDLEYHISYSRAATHEKPVTTSATPSRDAETGSGTGSLGNFKRTSQHNHAPQQNEMMPPFGQASHQIPDSIEPQAEDDNLDGVSTRSANERVWELILKSRKQRYKNKLAELEENYEDELKALRMDHREEIMAGEAENATLQMKVQELETSKATLEVDLREKEATIQQLVGTSQCVQQKYDKLKERCDQLSTVSEQTDHSASSHQNAATLAAIEGGKALQKKLDSALESNRVLATNLAAAHNNAVTFQRRAKELSSALEKSPNEVTDIRGVVELKDKTFSDLEQRAGECLSALTAVEGVRAEENKVASREIASLKAQLGKSEIRVRNLRNSKKDFQRQCESILAMLQGKVHKDDLMNAMDEYFQVAVQDNSLLQAEVERQTGEISSSDLKIVSLETAVDEAKKSLEAKTKACEEARHAVGTKDAELCVVQIELDGINYDHQLAMDEKDQQLASLNRRLEQAQTELMAKGQDEHLKFQDDKIQSLEKIYQDLSSTHQDLEHELEIATQVGADNAKAAIESQYESDEILALLKAAHAQIDHQREEIQGLRGLPSSIDIAQVLAMRTVLADAEAKVQELEREKGAERNGASEPPGGR